MYILGDTHGIRPIFQIIDKYKLKDCSLIHVGDLNLGFQEITRDVNNLLVLDEMLIENNINLYGIRGNHDNPIFWDKSIGLNLPKFHNLYLVEDYTVLEVENKKILFVGGAISIDRLPRKIDIPHPTWWKNEIFKYDIDKLNEIAKYCDKLDIVITHTSPDFCYPIGSNNKLVNYYADIEKRAGLGDLHLELLQERKYLTDLFLFLKENNLYPKHHFYGHFHQSKSETINGTIHKLLNINELKEVN